MMLRQVLIFLCAIPFASCDHLGSLSSKAKDDKNYQLSVLFCYLPVPKLNSTEPLVKYSDDPNLLAASFSENASLQYPAANFAVSVDRGLSWNFYTISETIKDFAVLSSDSYFVLSDQNVFSTKDRGKSWNKTPHNIDLSQNQIITLFSARPDQRLLLILRKSSSTYVYTSVDEGITWNHTILNGNLIYDEAFQNSRSRILTASSNANGTIGKFYVYLSSQAGDQYQMIFEKSLGTNSSNQVVPTRIFFEDSNLGFLSGNNLIYKTLDGGQSWSEISTSTRGSVFYSQGNTLYYATRNNLMKSDDGGTNLYRIRSNFTITKFYNLNSFYGRETGKNVDAYYSSLNSDGVPLPKLALKNYNGYTFQDSDFAMCRKTEEPLPVNIGE